MMFRDSRVDLKFDLLSSRWLISSVIFARIAHQSLIEGLLGNRFFIGWPYQTLPFFPRQSVSGTTVAWAFNGHLFINAVLDRKSVV